MLKNPRIRLIGLSLATLMMLGGLSLKAQEPDAGARTGADTTTPTATAPNPSETASPLPLPAVSRSARRVPPYFGQIGLTQNQKEEIYEIRALYLVRIEALKQQISDLEVQMMAECEGVLNDLQRQALEQRRQAAGRGRTPTTGEPNPPGR